jgi:hypothetical protein
MDLISYPTENYNSWLTEDEAIEYFESRILNDNKWDSCTQKEAALQTAFRSLAELNLDITFDDDKVISATDYTTTEAADILTALQQASCEQALHELMNDLDSPPITSMTLGGMVSAKIPDKFAKPARFSSRVLAILRPYIIARTVTRAR